MRFAVITGPTSRMRSRGGCGSSPRNFLDSARSRGAPLAAAASSTLENSFSRASQLRTRVNRDLMTHLRIYSEMQKRVLVAEDMEDADGGKDPDATD